MKLFNDQFGTMLDEALSLFGAKGLAERLEVNYRNLQNWSSEQLPQGKVLARLADLMGWSLVKTGVNADARLQAADFVKTQEGTYARKIDLRDYEIVPLVKHPDLLSTDSYIIPDNCIQRYDFIHKSTPTLSQCSPHLVAVKVEEVAIGTLLEQQDVILIDRGDCEVENGKIFLVRTPEGKTFLRRVIRDGESFTFYSSTHNLDPIICHLRAYGGEIHKAILGRAVRIEGDLRNL